MPLKSKRPPSLLSTTSPTINGGVEVKKEVVIKINDDDQPDAPNATQIDGEGVVTVDDSTIKRKKQKTSKRASDLVPAIPSAVFRRLVKEITSDLNKELRWEANAIEALQVDAEAYLISHFGEANKNRAMCGSGTLKKAHFVAA